MPIVSVVVPVYNVREYLGLCVDSVINQSYSDLEIILVDDGSTDDSGAICDEYDKMDNRVLVIHKANGGLSDARNAGIVRVTGKYVYFLDGDDRIAYNAIEKLVNFAERNKCDMVQGGFYYDYGRYCLYDDRRVKDEDEPFVIDRPTAMAELVKNEYIKNFAWGKLYLASIVKKYPFRKGVYFEDSYWQHHIVNETANYGVIPEPLYYYLQRGNSISGNYSIRNIDLLKGTEEKFLFVKNKYPELTDMMAERYWDLVCDSALIASRSGDRKLAEAYSDYRNRVENDYKEEFGKAMKYSVKYRLARHSTGLLRLYDLLQRIYCRIFTKNLKRIEWT